MKPLLSLLIAAMFCTPLWSMGQRDNQITPLPSLIPPPPPYTPAYLPYAEPILNEQVISYVPHLAQLQTLQAPLSAEYLPQSQNRTFSEEETARRQEHALQVQQLLNAQAPLHIPRRDAPDQGEWCSWECPSQVTRAAAQVIFCIPVFACYCGTATASITLDTVCCPCEYFIVYRDGLTSERYRTFRQLAMVACCCVTRHLLELMWNDN